jgi:hypothetical protein
VRLEKKAGGAPAVRRSDNENRNKKKPPRSTKQKKGVGGMEGKTVR